MNGESRWERLSERGSMRAIRLMGRLYEIMGRRLALLLLLPISLHFFLRERGSRRASRAYLERVYAHPEGRAHLRGPPGFFTPFWHYHEFAVQMLDRMVLWAQGLSRLRMDHEGAEYLMQLARERRGGLLIGSHLGSFDMPRRLAGEYGLVLNVVMFTEHAERINRFFEQLDPESQLRILKLELGGVRTAFDIKACLDRGELVGILADRLPAGGKEAPVFVDFLGREMALPLSPFRLACLLGCPTFLSLCLRKGDAHYETVVRPIGSGTRVPRQEREKAAQELARAWVRGLEEACLRHPFQWFNFYDVWRRPAA
jgi:predicted LPLAT superfamily acyltransferase